MITPLEHYQQAGYRAGKTSRNDTAFSIAETRWKDRAKALELHPEDKKAAEEVFKEAYRQASGFYNAPTYFR